MPSGFNTYSASVKVDFDSIFKAIGSTTPRANVGYKVGSTDLASRYKPITVVGSKLPFNTGYKTGSVDLGQLFMYINYIEATPTPTPTNSPTPSPSPSPTPTPTPTVVYSVQALNNTGGSSVSINGNSSGNTISLPAGTYNLVATPTTNYVFSIWSTIFGNSPATSTAASTTIAINQNTRVQANFLPYPTVQAENNTGGVSVVIANDSSGNVLTVAPGTYNLVANANTNYVFSYWSVLSGATPNGGIYAASTSVTVSANTTNHYVANFLPYPTLQAENNTGGASVVIANDSSGGVLTRAPGTYNLVANPTTNYVFSYWTVVSGATPNGGIYAQSTTVTVAANTTNHYVANFLPYPTLQAENSSGGLAVSIDGDGNGGVITRAPGTYNLIAYPDTANGYTFDYWQVVSGATPNGGIYAQSTSVTVAANTTNHYIGHFKL